MQWKVHTSTRSQLVGPECPFRLCFQPYLPVNRPDIVGLYMLRQLSNDVDIIMITWLGDAWPQPCPAHSPCGLMDQDYVMCILDVGEITWVHIEPIPLALQLSSVPNVCSLWLLRAYVHNTIRPCHKFVEVRFQNMLTSMYFIALPLRIDYDLLRKAKIVYKIASGLVWNCMKILG